MAPVEQDYGEVGIGTMVVVLDPTDYVFKVGIASVVHQDKQAPHDTMMLEVVIRENGKRQFLDVWPEAFRGGFQTMHAAEAHAAYLNRTD